MKNIFAGPLRRIVKLLLQYSNQLELNATDQVKNTPLHLACEDDAHPEVVKLLVEAGADQQAKNKAEKTPLEMAKPEVLSDIDRARIKSYTTFFCRWQRS